MLVDSFEGGRDGQQCASSCVSSCAFCDVIEEDPDFLKNAGMKAAQRSCLVRHLKRPPAAAGNAAAGGGA